MTIQQDLQRPNIGKYVELFQLDLTPIGGSVLYFTPNTGGTGNVSFGGQTYTPLPISGSGWQTSIDGAPPQPSLKVSNVARFVQPFLTEFQDLVGARVTRIQTLDKYLDSGATPDATQIFDTSVYRITQKLHQNKREIEFKLASVIDVPRLMFPKKQVVRSVFPGAGLFRKN